MQRIYTHFTNLYGEATARKYWKSIKDQIINFTKKNPQIPQSPKLVSSSDTILITYGDQFQDDNRRPLVVLSDFLQAYIGDTINTIHILPFFPYSSDDGFSVIDYTKVDPALGDWKDIQKINSEYFLMFDFVLNHISRESDWFQHYLNGDTNYQDYFIEVDPNIDLSDVVRPRALPLLTQVSTSQGKKHVWTTFSSDQIDLNYLNPDVALDMIKILLEYVSKGAKYIRMDAIAYLWKEVGTKSIHLPQTHEFVKFVRSILDAAAPQVMLITETNVPHYENISYFGKPIELVFQGNNIIRSDEAQMVYQFSLAPLILHTFLTQNSAKLTKWALSLDLPVKNTFFFNFIASHDGIGVRPAEGILTGNEIQKLADQTLRNKGDVSFKKNPDGTLSPYELNITLFDFLNEPLVENFEIAINRFMASQVIMLSLAGIPGIYIHSLIGSSNCLDCVSLTGRARSINREKFNWQNFSKQLDNPESRAAKILSRYKHILDIRRDLPAMAPDIPHKILFLDDRVFALVRDTPNPETALLCIINISTQNVNLEISRKVLGLENHEFINVINSTVIMSKGDYLTINLSPYEYIWLIKK